MAGQKHSLCTPIPGAVRLGQAGQEGKSSTSSSCLPLLRVMSNTSSFPICAMTAEQVTGKCFSWYQPALTRAWLCSWRSYFLEVLDAGAQRLA